MYVLLFCSFSPQSILTCLKGDSLTFSMIISSIKIRTNLIAKSLEISKSSTSRLFLQASKKIVVANLKKSPHRHILRDFKFLTPTPLRWWLAWWGTIDRLFLAKCGNIIAHSSGFYVKWSERCENHYYFVNGKDELNTFIEAQKAIHENFCWKKTDNFHH